MRIHESPTMPADITWADYMVLNTDVQSRQTARVKIAPVTGDGTVRENRALVVEIDWPQVRDLPMPGDTIRLTLWTVTT